MLLFMYALINNTIGADIIGDSYTNGFEPNKSEYKGIIAVTGEGLVGQISSVSSNWSIVLGKIYPSGIKIGKVLTVHEDKGAIMKSAIIEPSVDFSKIEEIFVVAPKDRREIKY